MTFGRSENDKNLVSMKMDRSTQRVRQDLEEFQQRNVPFLPNDLCWEEGYRPFTMLIHGAPRSGKSVFLYDIVRRMLPRFQLIYLLTLSDDMRFQWAPLIGDRNIYRGFGSPRTKQLLQNIVDVSSKKVKDYRKRTPEATRVPPELLKRVLLIADDVIEQNSAQHLNGYFSQLATNYRHLNLTLIVTSQYPRALNKIFRDLCEYNVIFRHEGVENAKFFQDLAFPWASNGSVQRIIADHTHEYQCIIAQKTSRGIVYSLYKAPFEEE